MSVREQILNRIHAFIADLEEATRLYAIEGLVGGRPAAARPALSRPVAAVKKQAARKPVPAPVALPKAPRAEKKAPGIKRAPEELERLTADLQEYIEINPGEGIEAIARGLKVPSKELALPIKKLLGSGTIDKRGEKRSTKYFPR